MYVVQREDGKFLSGKNKWSSEYPDAIICDEDNLNDWLDTIENLDQWLTVIENYGFDNEQEICSIAPDDQTKQDSEYYIDHATQTGMYDHW